MKLEGTVALDKFAEYLKKRGNGSNTIESYTRDARYFLNFLAESSIPLDQVNPETLLYYQRYLLNDKSEKENSVRRQVIGIKVFFRFVTSHLGQQDSVLDESPIPPRDEIPPRKLTSKNIDALFSAAARSPSRLKSTRDVAIIGLLAFEGIKASELIALSWGDYLDGTLRISGTRSRVFKLFTETDKLLSTYREEAFLLLKGLPGAAGRPMFVGFKGRDTLSPNPQLTRHGVKFLLYELGDLVNLNHLNTEDLRNFAIKQQADWGVPLDDIMVRLGLRQMSQIAKNLRYHGLIKKSENVRSE